MPNAPSAPSPQENLSGINPLFSKILPPEYAEKLHSAITAREQLRLQRVAEASFNPFNGPAIPPSQSTEEHWSAAPAAPRVCPMQSPPSFRQYGGSNYAQHRPTTTTEGKPSAILPSSQVRKLERDLECRALVGLLAGPRPPVEMLKLWIKQQWSPRGAEVETIQCLPKNHFLFVFKHPDMAFNILSAGQWHIRNSPLCLFMWNKTFNPDISASRNYPIWVEFPNLHLHFHQHLGLIASKLGKVLGGRPRFLHPSLAPPGTG
ncbi:hypothetical protein L7F22_035418 [Adiantum nelumboides]|nr:hypothetical protein [Adiantum nelumboides]